MKAADYTPRRVIFAYLSTSGLFTLATSLIWAINTIFLIQRGGLTLFEVMLVNTVYLVAQMLCEVPTGVIADTIGRKASYLLSIGDHHRLDAALRRSRRCWAGELRVSSSRAR